jgi:formyl-CoA transferase
MHLFQGILLALLQRQRSGEGQAINVSLYNSMLAMQMQEAAMWLMRKRELNWGAMPLSGAFATSDGALVMVGAFKTNPLQEICIALDLDDLSADPRYATPEKQAAERPALQAIFRERFATNTTITDCRLETGSALRAGPFLPRRSTTRRLRTTP